MVAPLNDLIKGAQGQEIRWTECAKGTFKSVENTLCEKPVLHTPDFNQQFILETTASRTVLGAELTQKVNREKRPVAYASRQLMDHEIQYTTIE